MKILTNTIVKVRYYLFFVVAISLLSTTAFADIVIVVNPNSGVSSISADEVKAIFLGKGSSLPNGTKAVPIEQAEGGTRTLFIERVLHKTEEKLTAYWARLVFSGKGSPPKSVKDDDAVKAFVAETPGGIGYIDSAKADNSVTTVLSIK